jgi:hypothetical protein
MEAADHFAGVVAIEEKSADAVGSQWGHPMAKD